MNGPLFKGCANLVHGETKPMIHLNLNTPTPIFSEDDNSNIFAKYVNSVVAEVVDHTDKVMVEAIVKEAAAQGVNDLFLIDKEFIMSAIKHEMIRRAENENSQIR